MYTNQITLRQHKAQKSGLLLKCVRFSRETTCISPGFTCLVFSIRAVSVNVFINLQRLFSCDSATYPENGEPGLHFYKIYYKCEVID